MSILPHALRQAAITALRTLGTHWLTGSCLLCAADSGEGLFCAACRTDLPQHGTTQCPVCADCTLVPGPCSNCRHTPPCFDATLACFRYEFPVDRIIHALKYGHQLAIAAWLGRTLAGHPAMSPHDCIMAMPLHPQRVRERGFNQSIEIARAISRITQQPLRLDALRRIRATVPQAELPFKERQANVRGAFECTEDLTGCSILLVDDVMTSGASLGECARVLKLHGASRVTLAVAARALRQA